MQMSHDTSGTTVGIWNGVDDTVFEEFDEHFGTDPSYSRSARIKDAMRLAIAVDKALSARDVDLDIGTRRGQNAVTGAIHNEFREE